jgi:hypothetical protein
LQNVIAVYEFHFWRNCQLARTLRSRTISERS